MISRRYLGDVWRFGGRRLLGLAVLTIAAALTEGVGLLMLVPLLELVGAGGGSSVGAVARDAFAAVGVSFTLGWVLAFYLALVLLRGLLVRARTLGTARFQLEFVDWERLRLLDAVTRADWLHHVRRRSSDLIHAVTSDIARLGQGTNVLLQATTRLVLATAYVAVALRLSVPMTAAAALVSVLLSTVLWPLMRRARRLGREQTTVGRLVFGSLGELQAGMKLAKVHGTEEAHLGEVRGAVGDLRTSVLQFQRTQSTAALLYQVGTAGAVAALVWAGVTVFDVPTAQLLTLIVVMSRLLPIPGATADDVRTVANMIPAYEEAMAVLDSSLAAAERPVVSAPPHPINESIELERVRFTYPGMHQPAVDDVSIRLPAHTTTALVGRSGAGKTTLADIVLGLLACDGGAVRVDGRPLDSIDLGSWRAAVSYVPQDPFLFHQSLRENVCWGAAQCSDDEVVRLLETVGLGSLLSRLPEGLDTVVGERGHRLSGGERQRVVLARALARRPQLLVLDEATSHLDAETEQASRAAIDALHGELTVLVIAHRLGTVRHADQIVVLEDGRLCERGGWDDLVLRGGRFAELLVAGGMAG